MKIEIDRIKESFLKENYFKKLYELTQFDMSKSIQTPQYEKRYVKGFLSLCQAGEWKQCKI